MNKTNKQIEINESIETLKTYLKKDMTIYSIKRNVSSNGMTRNLSFKVINDMDKNEIVDLSYPIAKVLEYPFNYKCHALEISDKNINECYGMDLQFHIIDILSRVLFGYGNKLKSRTL